MKKLVVATKNRGKLLEIAELLHDQDIMLYSLADFPGMPDVVEDGSTFEENAKKQKLRLGRYWMKVILPAVLCA